MITGNTTQHLTIQSIVQYIYTEFITISPVYFIGSSGRPDTALFSFWYHCRPIQFNCTILSQASLTSSTALLCPATLAVLLVPLLGSLQLEQFHYLDLFHSSVATAPVSVTTTCCRRRDSRSWKVQHTNRRPWALLPTQHLSQSLLSMPKSKFVVSAAKNSSILWILVLQCCYCSTSVEQPAVSFNVVVPAVSISGSVQHIILPQISRAVNAPA